MNETPSAFAPPTTEQAVHQEVRGLERLGRYTSWLALAEIPVQAALAGLPLLELPESVELEAYLAVAGLALLWLVPFTVVWVAFHTRAVQNLGAMGHELDYGRVGQTVFWFVPLLNLWLPYRALLELVLRSSGEVTREAGSWMRHRSRTAAVVRDYWGFYVAWAVGGLCFGVSVAGSLIMVALRIMVIMRYVGLVQRIVEDQGAPPDRMVLRDPDLLGIP